MKTLVYHSGALGDFITVFPALSRWKRRFNHTHITLLGKTQYGWLAAASGLVDAIWDVESVSFAPMFSPGDLPSSLSRRLHGFEAALLFAGSDSPVAAHAVKCGIPDVRHQPPFPCHPAHIIDYHLELIEDGVVSKSEKIPMCTPESSMAEQGRTLTASWGAFAVMHPGSGGMRKNWPLKRFTQLASMLKKHALDNVVWLLGPAEKDMVIGGADPVMRNEPLSLLVHILAAGSLFIGNDSGIAHLAAAAGCPSVVLFGASDPGVWRPAGKHVRIICGHAYCAPCHPGGMHQQSCRQECMDSISLNDVYEACIGAATYSTDNTDSLEKQPHTYRPSPL